MSIAESSIAIMIGSIIFYVGVTILINRAYKKHVEDKTKDKEVSDAYGTDFK